MSFAQESIWLFEQVVRPSAVNQNVFRIEVEGPLDIEALDHAINEVVRRHVSLRSRFERGAGLPVAKVASELNICLRKADLKRLSPAERESEAEQIRRAFAGEPFDLANGPMIRVKLLQRGIHENELLLAMHHIVADEPSVWIFLRELAGIYKAIVGHKSNAWTNRTRSYAESILSERGEVVALKRELLYWTAKLGGKLPVLDLPTDRPRPPVQTHNGSTVAMAFEKDVKERLRAFASEHEVTDANVLLAVFKAVLHRYSGQEDVIVGTPRERCAAAGTEDLIGAFGNVLPLRTHVTGDTRFSELLVRVSETVRGAHAHERLPFAKLLEVLHPERDLSRAPVFQAMFATKSRPDTIPQIPGCTCRVNEIHTGTAKYDLTLVVEQDQGDLRGYVEFNTDLFDRATAEHLCGHVKTMLEAAIADPEKTIGKLPLLTSMEREEIVMTWNATDVHVRHDRCVHEMFEEQVERTPDAVAAIFEDEQLTYRELNRRANGISRRLRELGAGPEVRVGICVPRSMEMLAGLLGILKSGAAYVPLDPAYPRERLAFMVEDAQVHALLTTERLANGVGHVHTVTVPVEGIECDDNPKSGATPDHLAYVIYTSGSTGKPKGVMIQHRNVVNFFAGMDQVLGPTPGVWLALTSICFDISVLELLWTVTRGFTVVIQSEEGGLRASGGNRTNLNPDGYTIPEQMRRAGVTHLQCTPSLMGMLLQEKGAREAVASVKTLLLGGEALPAALAEQLAGVTRLLNMYGPTETTVWSTCEVIAPGRPISIGRPIANTRVYILDRFQQPTPVGVPGELYIGGAGVAAGYLNRPELTAERFVPDTLTGAARDKMYRTGDLVRYRRNGTIEFLGRVDHQVKLRGFRIELGEIEASLRQCEGVRDAAVAVKELSTNDKRLVAYIVADRMLETAELRRWLMSRLPDYMVPALFTYLPTMPLTPNGKIDRKALPEPAGLRNHAVAPRAAARTTTEETIAKIWCELLRVPNVSLTDRFFDLGGDSLLMVQLQARMEAALGVEIPILRLFQNSTVKAMASLIGEPRPEPTEWERIRDRASLQRQLFSTRPSAKAAA
ncbi:MAG: amino acid adenylation domain-containing protein [Verrucomicrobia subdivision 3 bacterium]|nr:amino acid adenylation domain-containing protein [Limisphaerales bacterium]